MTENEAQEEIAAIHEMMSRAYDKAVENDPSVHAFIELARHGHVSKLEALRLAIGSLYMAKEQYLSAMEVARARMCPNPKDHADMQIHCPQCWLLRHRTNRGGQ
jgi:hypothetical protein